ncbi:AMP-binding protein [Mycobacteroides immunogenum]|uniref:AMP-dependent synthetase n=1 Tax=Mycobacteroides immunogenum TaxID=83262 RepID=A0A7V8RU43_9MYCO|nr:AMP-binding protein [Mycobacteroides immunogenum]AMT72309.1 AMP-dependent synthetase [Mycobacteroides immunogenum]ANO05451.1 AMP-dependent synthetase [Mycobacteroides immunogenum]KIU37562.1 AMP-dependent synthetase [Mycobacteroides immunogenum]KPG02988.1 AMP-dependent synthetase [Mycobacteroides immunogenum]KPG03064.1 AMP-dependent synthetase [Mycobacteroides immunogenum]
MTTPQTLPRAFQGHVAERPDELALSAFGRDYVLTWAQYGAEVERVAGGLAELGLGRGDVLATLLTNRPEFNITELAANHLGATTFSIYNTCSAEQIHHLLTDSAAKIVVTERQYVDTVKASGVGIEHLLVVEDGDFERLQPPAGFDFAARWQAVQPDDVLCMIYTSGTTGPPKGVEHTHRGALGMAGSLAATFPLGPGDTTISYLPSAHAADRCVCHYLAVATGAHIVTLSDAAQLPQALPEVRPSAFAAVPRMWEKLKAGVERQLDAMPGLREAFEADTPEVIAAVRERLGLDKVRWALSSAAPIPLGVYAFLQRLGIPVSEIWGMSETGIATAASPERARIGTVGTVMPGYETKVLEDGELLVRAPFIMRGYRNLPDKTAEAIDAEGWMHTGDIVTVDDDGYFTIVDRKKELIINSGGKNMSPTNIENAIRTESPLVGPLIAVGDRRPYNVAVVSLEADAVRVYAEKLGLAADPAALAKDPRVLAEVQRAVDAGNAKLARIEQIKRFAVVPDTWESGGEFLTPTGKLKRRVITDNYAATIDDLYGAPAS